MTVQLIDLVSNDRIVISGVYGPSYMELKAAFWEEFAHLSCYVNELWIIGGDFNITRYIDEHRGNLFPFLLYE